MDGACFQVLCEDQSGRGTAGEVIDVTVAAPFVNNRRIVEGRDRSGDALSPLSSRFDETIGDCGGRLLRCMGGQVEGIAAGRNLDDDVAADIFVFARIGQAFDSFRDVCRESCCSMIIRVLLASDFSPVGIDFGIGKALQRILVRKEITVFGSATDNPHDRVDGLEPGRIRAVLAAMMMNFIEGDWRREGRDAWCLDIAIF